MNSDCLFCKIISGMVPSQKFYEDGEVVAFADIHPVAPLHLLLVPRKHIASIAELEYSDRGIVGELTWRAREIAKEQGIAQDGYRLVFNVRRHAGQVVDHLHLHLIGGKQLGRMV